MEVTAAAVVFVIGAPGSGKGTLCRRLSDEYGFCHLSIGDTLRRLVSNSMTDLVTASQVQRGELISTEKLINILHDSMQHGLCNSRRLVLVDGLPRELDQAMPVEKKIGSPALVLFFDCREEVAKDRFLKRNLPGREADNAVLFQKRYDQFAMKNPKILKMYKERNLLLEVDTNGETEISYEILLNSLGNTKLAGFLSRTAENTRHIDSSNM